MNLAEGNHCDHCHSRHDRNEDRANILFGTLFKCVCLFLSLVLHIAFVQISNAATINAASAARADVAAAVLASASGDTVVIPTGTATDYATTITITNGITITGSGSLATVLSGSANYLFTITLESNQTTRITNIKFVGGTTAITAQGSNRGNKQIRVDHCWFTNFTSWAINCNTLLGVVDHNVFLGVNQVPVAYVFDTLWNDVLGYGDHAWTNALAFGTDQFLFFEDNAITNSTSLTTIDGFGGSRYVFRYNTGVNIHVEFHGTESGGRNRGGQAVEVYNNNFIGNDTSQTPTYYRSGSGLIHDNTISGYTANASLSLINFRNHSGFSPFSIGSTEVAGADGKNPWDVNVAGGPFATGTATNNSVKVSTTITFTNTAASGWTNDFYRGYSITRTSGKTVTLTSSAGTVTASCTSHGFSSGDVVSVVGANQTEYNTTAIITVVNGNTFTYALSYGNTPASPATGTIFCFEGHPFSEITANGSDWISYKASGLTGATDYDLRFEQGATFALYKVDHAMDQAGRTGGSLVTGDIPTRPGSWNDQVTSPWYEWNNTREGGADVNFSADELTIRSGEHYLNNTQKPGYTPYTYPHPLVSGEVASLPAPKTSGRVQQRGRGFWK